MIGASEIERLLTVDAADGDVTTEAAGRYPLLAAGVELSVTSWSHTARHADGAVRIRPA